jgi:alanyl-tRNA synthetase
LDANAILKAMTTRFGGKGGGKPEMAQGGGLSGLPQDIVSALREAVQQALVPATAPRA